MGRVFVFGIAIAIGYMMGYRDARAHPDHILGRVVTQIKVLFNAKPANDIDAVMTKVEGKN